MEMVPLHGQEDQSDFPCLGSARRFPLMLGRRELASWWWNTCPCRRRRRPLSRPCHACRRVGENVTSLPKAFLRVDEQGRVRFVTDKNRHLLLHYGTRRVKQQSESLPMLQVGDEILIGKSKDEVWMAFRVQASAAHTQSTANDHPARIVTPGTELVTGKRHGRDDDDEKKRNQCSSKRRLRFAGRPSSPPTPPPFHGARESLNTDVKPAAVSVVVQQKVVVPETPPTPDNPSSSLRHEFAQTKIPEEHDKADKGEPSLLENASEVSSILSLPKCPSYSQTQESYSQSQASHFDGRKGPCRGSTALTSWMTRPSQDERTHQSAALQLPLSPHEIPVSSIPTVEWKKMTKSGGVATVRSSIAALVVIQRRRLKDPNWLPELLKDSFVGNDMNQVDVPKRKWPL